MKGYAFFDFDNTIIYGDAGPLLGMHLFHRRRERLEEGPLRRVRKTALWTRATPYLAWMVVQAGLYKLRARRRSSIVRSAYRGFRGVPVAAMERVLDGFVADQIAPRIHPDVRREMESHAAAGRTNVIITTGMERLVERVLPFLPPETLLIGCELEIKDGRFTGRVLRGPLYGLDKANIMRAMCRGAGVELSDCHAYTDHHSDHHMLEAVGHGVCINPAARLRQAANANGWRVLDLPDPREGKEKGRGA